MELALKEAAKCTPSPTAFCVGAIIVKTTSTSHPDPLSTGFSRELEGNTHAEQCAIDKLVAGKGEASAKETLQGADMYTTMEPCSVRLSGNKPCTDRILECGITRVFLGTMEPDEFVKCEGVRLLQDKGVEVYNVPGFAEKCLLEARRGR